MKAVVFHEHGGIDKLRYEERPDPLVKDNEVLVRVKDCALNHLDIWANGPSKHSDSTSSHLRERYLR
jgi:NADPH:quinone reductase-like Zn-dependent oxidoreductase